MRFILEAGELVVIFPLYIRARYSNLAWDALVWEPRSSKCLGVIFPVRRSDVSVVASRSYQMFAFATIASQYNIKGMELIWKSNDILWRGIVRS